MQQTVHRIKLKVEELGLEPFATQEEIEKAYDRIGGNVEIQNRDGFEIDDNVIRMFK